MYNVGGLSSNYIQTGGSRGSVFKVGNIRVQIMLGSLHFVPITDLIISADRHYLIMDPGFPRLGP